MVAASVLSAVASFSVHGLYAGTAVLGKLSRHVGVGSRDCLEVESSRGGVGLRD